MRKLTTRDLSLAAIIAAVYAVLTLILPIPAFTGIQVRLSEALTVLPFLFPATAPGLVVGCFIANLFSPYSLDVIFGTAADRKSTRLNSSHITRSRMPSSA